MDAKCESVSILSWPHRISQQLSELGVCFTRGATVADTIALINGTTRFHLGNHLRRPPSMNNEQSYRIRVASQNVDVRLRPGAGDFFVLHEVFTGGCYAIPSAWRSEIRTVVDLGAHVGLTALYLLETLPYARIACVEAAPDNAALLRHNLSSFRDRAIVIESAISSRAGTTTFEGSGWSWQRGVRRDGSGDVVVRADTVDSVMQRAHMDHIDLLKVDVEGAEAEIFDNRPAWLEKVERIIIEIHPPYSSNQFSGAIGPAGFRLIEPNQALGNRMLMATRDA